MRDMRKTVTTVYAWYKCPPDGIRYKKVPTGTECWVLEIGLGDPPYVFVEIPGYGDAILAPSMLTAKGVK